MRRIALIPLVILVLAGCQSVSEPEVDAPILPPAFQLTGGIAAVKLFDAIPAFETGSVTSPASAIVFAEKTLTVTRTVGSSLIISSTVDGTGPIVVDNFMTIDGTNVCIGGIESPAGNQNCFAGLLGGRTGPMETLLSPVVPLDVTTTIPLGTSTVTFQLRDFGAIAGNTNLFLMTVTSAINVTIDIKPGSDPNSINLGNKGGISVAILTTDDFDAADVDPATVTLGNDDGNDTSVATRKNGSLEASLEDVDDDGDLDLILHFDTQALVGNGDLDANTTELILNGETTGGQAIQGRDKRQYRSVGQLARGRVCQPPSVPAAFGALAFAGPLPIGASPALAAPCTTLHVSVLPVADGWPRRRTDAPVGRPPDDETAEAATQQPMR